MAKLNYSLVIFALVGLAVASDDYPQCHETNLQWFPHQLDCTLYFLCHHGNTVPRSCAPGLFFNDATGQCMIPSEAKCTLSCPAEDDPANPLFLPDYADCSQFYICYNGHAIHRSCASGLRFDTEHDWCNFEELVDCGYRGDSGGSGVRNRTSTTTLPPPPPPPEDIFTPPPVTVTTSNPDVFYDCPLDVGPFYFPHSIRCNKYFRCYVGVSHLETCPEGLDFDQFLLTCKENANCYANNPTTSTPRHDNQG